jgi:hypothetical protein
VRFENVLPIFRQDWALVPLPRQAHSESVTDGDCGADLGSSGLRRLCPGSGQLLVKGRHTPLC